MVYLLTTFNLITQNKQKYIWWRQLKYLRWEPENCFITLLQLLRSFKSFHISFSLLTSINTYNNDDDNDKLFLWYGWPTKSAWPYFQPGPLSEILTIANLRHTASRIWTCADLEFRLCWIKLYSSDNHYTTAPHCCKLDADSECLKSSKLVVFVATATWVKAINCSPKKSPPGKFEGGRYLQFYRICANRATDFCSNLYVTYIL